MAQKLASKTLLSAGLLGLSLLGRQWQAKEQKDGAGIVECFLEKEKLKNAQPAAVHM